MFPILDNLRGFFGSRPPLVVFMICMGSFAIALITFAYIVKVKAIPNPDVEMDWNTFLDRFTKVDMCLPRNASDQVPLTNSTGGKIPMADLNPADFYYQIFHELVSKTINKRSVTKRDIPINTPAKDHSTSKSVPSKSQSSLLLSSSSSSTVVPTQNLAETDNKFVNLTIAMNVNVYTETMADAHLIVGSTQYISLITGEQMTLKGKIKDSELAVALSFPFNLTAGTCKEWSDKTCIKHAVTVCINFQGPSYLFPKTEAPSPSEVCSVRPVAMDENSSPRMMSAAIAGRTYNWCEKGIRIRPSFSFDESLTVMLSLEDRSLINLHLMRTSYFLFVMVVTFFCYAIIKGRPTKSKHSHIPYIEKVPTYP